MSDMISVPGELAGSFKRIMRRVPVDLRKDDKIPGIILAYLKLGGEKLARQAVAAMDKSLKIQIAKRRRRLREEALLRAAEIRNLQAMESEADDDDPDDDTDDEFESDDRDTDDDLEVF